MRFQRLRAGTARLRARLWYWGRLRDWPLGTAAMLLINTVVFLVIHLQWGSERELVLYTFGAYDSRSIWHGQLWRLVTPMFLHAGWFHLITNQLALFLFCGEVERSIGTLPWLGIYFACGVSACAASGILPPDAISVGASGAIYGVMGVFLAGTLGEVTRDGDFRLRTRLLAIFLVILAGMEIAVAGLFNTDLAGHFGGLAAGLWFACLILPPRYRHILGALKRVRLEPVMLFVPPTNGTHPQSIDCLPRAEPIWLDSWDRRKLAILGLGLPVLTAMVLYSIYPFGNPHYQLLKIDQLAYAGKLGEAQYELDDQTPTDPSLRREIQYRLAVLERLEGDNDGAWTRLDKLTAPPARCAKNPLEMIYWALEESNAFYLEELSRLSKQHPNGPRQRLEMIAAGISNPEKLRAQNKNLEAVPLYAMYNNHAWTLVILGVRLEEALKYALKAVEQSRGYVTLDTLGRTQAKLGRFAEAETSLSEATRLLSFGSAELYLGQAKMHLGQTDQAARHLRRALAHQADRSLGFTDVLSAHRDLRELAKSR